MSGCTRSAKEIFLGALETPDSGARDAYVRDACGTDLELQREVMTLLKLHDEPDRLLDQPRIDFRIEGADEGDETNDLAISEKPRVQIGPYKLREQIGEGGFGTVYVAEQEQPVSRKVALKIVKPGMDTKEIIARFEAERQALAMMDHPNIAKVFDAGTTHNGRPYFVMELVHGLPITGFCDEQQFTNVQRLQLFVDVCGAVQHAHQKGVIHRDLKPTNIMVTMHDDKAVPKVIDFGVSKALSRKLTCKSIYTAYGQLVGTPLYMSPEQTQMSGLDVDTRSDVYSLGVLLYELLTGVTPFEEETLKKAEFDELRRIIREDEPPRPSARVSTLHDELLSTVCDRRKVDRRSLAPFIRGELDWIVMKALQKDRNRRYESASALAADVARYVKGDQVLACPPSVGYRLRKFTRRNRVALSFASLILLFLMLLGAGLGWTVRDHLTRQRRVSEQVALILDDVGRLEREQKWPEALALAKRAEAALAAGEALEDVQARVDQAVSDLKLVARLEEIRLLASELKGQGFDYEEANQHYAAALREYGVDVDTLPAREAASRLRLRTGVLPALIAALDDWASCRQAVEDEAAGEPLARLIEALDTDPWRRRVREALATNNIQALEELAGSEEVAHQAPATAAILAGSLAYRGRHDLASEVLDKALQQHPDDFWLHFKSAAAHSSSRPRRTEEAIRHYTAARALRPGSVVANYNLGVVLHANGNREGAIACYRQAIRVDPTFAKAHTNLGVALKEKGQLDDASACYRRAIEVDPSFATPHMNLGGILKEKGQLDEAIACFRRAVELNPKYTDAHINLGAVLQAQGQLDEAIACYRRATQLQPELALAQSYAAAALAAQGQLQESIACFRDATELEPHDAKNRYNLGLVLEAHGNVKGAIACYRRAIELNPKLAPIYNNLAWTLATANESNICNPPEALELARKAVQLDAKPWAFWDTLSVAAYRAGDWKTSLDARQEKLKRHSITTEDRLFLAMTYWQLGNQMDARKWYEETTSRSGNEETTSTRLTNLHHEAKQLLAITTSPIEAKDSEPR